MSKFDDALTEELEGSYVYAASADGREYQGWVQTIHPKYQHVILRDAENLKHGRDAGRVFVRQVDAVEELEPGLPIQRVALDDIEPAPYHVRDLDPSKKQNRYFVAETRSRGFTGSYPVVRPHPDGDGYQIVEGHRRIWAAREAGLGAHPVEIDDAVDDWELALRFITGHLPDEGQIEEDGSTIGTAYDDHETEAAIRRLREEWGDQVLDVHEVRFNTERLGLGVDVPDDDVDASDSTEETETSSGSVSSADDTAEGGYPDTASDGGESPVAAVVTECQGVGSKIASLLVENGYDSLGALATAERDELTEIESVGPMIALRVIEEAEAEVGDTSSRNHSSATVATDGSGAAAQQPETNTNLDVVDVDTPGGPMDDSVSQDSVIVEKYLPDDATPDDVRELAKREDSLDGVAAELDMEVQDARVLLFNLDVNGKVAEASRYRGRAD